MTEIGRSLRERVREILSRGASGSLTREAFEDLALRALAWQRARCSALDRALRAASEGVEDVGRGLDGIVGVPTDAFKSARIATFDEARREKVFFTSGTTREVRGAHEFETLELYEASALASAARWLLPAERYRFVLLAESDERAPHSSLSAMLAMFVRRWGDTGAGEGFFVRDGALDVEGVRAAIADATAEGARVALLGATFAFVHLFDAVGDGRENASGQGRLALPPGSVVMPTGGFKGRSRELEPDELLRSLRGAFAVERSQIVQEYGMTELTSQAYEAHAEGGPPGRYFAPPWMRVDAVDPDTLAVLPPGHEGILRVIDLANLGSCVAIQTADLGVAYAEGFEVRGRIAGATPRGCARAMDALLDGSSR